MSEYVHLNGHNEACEEREDGMYVRCPYCGNWNQMHGVLGSGCECGAEVRTLAEFSKGESK